MRSVYGSLVTLGLGVGVHALANSCSIRSWRGGPMRRLEVLEGARETHTHKFGFDSLAVPLDVGETLFDKKRCEEGLEASGRAELTGPESVDIYPSENEVQPRTMSSRPICSTSSRRRQLVRFGPEGFHADGFARKACSRVKVWPLSLPSRTSLRRNIKRAARKAVQNPTGNLGSAMTRESNLSPRGSNAEHRLRCRDAAKASSVKAVR